MLTLNLIQTISKRFQVNELQVKLRLQDFTDEMIEKALQRTYTSFDDLTFFLEEFQESEEVVAHLRGYKGYKEYLECLDAWTKATNEIKAELGKEN